MANDLAHAVTFRINLENKNFFWKTNISIAPNRTKYLSVALGLKLYSIHTWSRGHEGDVVKTPYKRLLSHIVFSESKRLICV